MASKLVHNSSHNQTGCVGGFNQQTQIYHSLRPPPPTQLPDETTPLSITDYIFTLYNSHSHNTTNLLSHTLNANCFSFSQLQSHVTTLSSSLINRIGLSTGDTAFILSHNSIHIPLLYLSLFAIGVIVSPANPAGSLSEVSRQLALTSPVIAFATSETAHKLPSLRHAHILLDSPEFESLMSLSTPSPEHRVVVKQSDTAAVLYSSGTTGRVKGVALTHRNLICSINGAMVSGQERRVVVAMCTVPLFHAYGFVYCLRCVALGESLVVMNKFNLEVMMKSIQQYRVTNLVLVPPLVVAMISNPTRVYHLSSLQIVFSGGAPLPIPLIKRFNTLFPNVALVQAYGMTETTAGVFRTVGPFESKRLGASGRLVYNCQAKIVDPQTGIGLPPFKQGELWIRGPLIMKGYVHDEVATSTTLTTDGWLRTGDLCYFDDEGFLFYVDRIKELIKCNGYQVPPAELEELLQSHPHIVEAAVVPYPDEKAGQVPVAFVVRTPGSTIDESLIKEFVAKEVAPYKKLRQVSFIDSIPKNATGKVLRKELVKLALSNVASSRL